jgi:hypothetical protein
MAVPQSIMLRYMAEFRRSSDASKHKVEESGYFCWWQLPRRLVDTERKTLLCPISKDLDEFAAGKQWIDAEGEGLRNAKSSRAGSKLGGKVVDNQPTGDVDLDHFADAMELPGEWRASYRVAKTAGIRAAASLADAAAGRGGPGRLARHRSECASPAACAR